MNIKRYLLVILGIIFTTLVVGCSSDQSSENESKSGNKSKNDTLIIYSNSVSNGRGDWLKEKAAEAGYQIEIVESGGSDLFNRLLAEKNNPIAHVTFGLSQMDWSTLKKENALEKFEPKWKNELPQELVDPDQFYYPIVEQRIVMLYNKDTYTEETAPKDWPDLWEKEEFHGKYHVPGELGGGTNRAAIYNILTRYLDENGELGVSSEGWEAVKKYIQNGYITPGSEDRQANLANGTVPISFHYSSGIPGIEETFSFEAGIVSPKVGVPSTIEQVGIMNHGEDYDYSLAIEFVDWFGSAEVQGEWAQKFGSIPVNKGAVDQATDRMKEIIESTTVQKIDYEIVGEYIDEWMEKIELEIF